MTIEEQNFWLEMHQTLSRIKEVAEAIRQNSLRPSVYLKPSISIDGDVWCMLYGDNIQEGVVGFGKTPAQASDDFDKNWYLEEIKN